MPRRGGGRVRRDVHDQRGRLCAPSQSAPSHGALRGCMQHSCRMQPARTNRCRQEGGQAGGQEGEQACPLTFWMDTSGYATRRMRMPRCPITMAVLSNSMICASASRGQAAAWRVVVGVPRWKGAPRPRAGTRSGLRAPWLGGAVREHSVSQGPRCSARPQACSPSSRYTPHVRCTAQSSHQLHYLGI